MDSFIWQFGLCWQNKNKGTHLRGKYCRYWTCEVSNRSKKFQKQWSILTLGVSGIWTQPWKSIKTNNYEFFWNELTFLFLVAAGLLLKADLSLNPNHYAKLISAEFLITRNLPGRRQKWFRAHILPPKIYKLVEWRWFRAKRLLWIGLRWRHPGSRRSCLASFCTNRTNKIL